jgi:hypothetical protein
MIWVAPRTRYTPQVGICQTVEYSVKLDTRIPRVSLGQVVWDLEAALNGRDKRALTMFLDESVHVKLTAARSAEELDGHVFAARIRPKISVYHLT